MRKVIVKNITLNWDRTRSEGPYGGYSIQIEFNGDRYEELYKFGRAKISSTKWRMNLRSTKPIKVIDSCMNELPDEVLISNQSIGNIMLLLPDTPISFRGNEIRKGIPIAIQITDYNGYIKEDF